MVDYCVQSCCGLLGLIPVKVYTPFQKSVQLTCLDCNSNVIVLGTEVGQLYLFNRHRHKLARLVAEHPITKVCMGRCPPPLSYDFCATGQKSGLVCLLRLPSSEPGHSRKLMQYSISSMSNTIHHRDEITAMHWSYDGSKLFSGDKTGLVIMTLVNFEAEAFQTIFVCMLDSAVVQIDYRDGTVLASCLSKSVIVDLSEQCTVVNIGSQERKKFGEYGIQYCLTANKWHILTARPGCKIWTVDQNGQVTKTVDYSNLVLEATKIRADILLPDFYTPRADTVDFGPLIYVHPKMILTYSNNGSMFCIDPVEETIGFRCDFTTSISDVAVHKIDDDNLEIFVLTIDRHLIRLGTNADCSMLTTLPQKNAPNPSSSMTESMFGDLLKTGSFKTAFKEKKQAAFQFFKRKNETNNNAESSSEMKSEADVEGGFAAAFLDRADNMVATFIDHVGGIGAGAETGAFVSDQKSDTPSSELAWDDSYGIDRHLDPDVTVVRRHKSYSKKGEKSKNDSDDDEIHDDDNNQLVHESNDTGVEADASENRSETESCENKDVLEGRSRDALEQELFGEYLPQIDTKTSHTLVFIEEGEHADQNFEDENEAKEGSTHSQEPGTSEIESFEGSPQMDYTEMLHENVKDLEVPVQNAELEILGEEAVTWKLDADTQKYGDVLRGNDSSEMDIWSSIKTTHPVTELAACENYLLYCSHDLKIRFMFDGRAIQSWINIKQPGTLLRMSADGRKVFRVHEKKLWKLENPSPQAPKGSSGDIWQPINCQFEVQYLSVVNAVVWIVSVDGQVYVFENGAIDPVECDFVVKYVNVSDSGVIWALCEDNTIIFRHGCCCENPKGMDWVQLLCPVENICTFYICDDVAWILDKNGQLYFTTNVTREQPYAMTAKWWQVPSPLLDSKDEKLSATEWLASWLPLQNYEQSMHLCVLRNGIYIACGNKIFSTRCAVSGHRWRKTLKYGKYGSLDSFNQIEVKGFLDETKDHIWLLRPNGELFAFQPVLKKLVSIPNNMTVKKPRCISYCCSKIWLLDSSGCLFMAHLINDEISLEQSDWIHVDLEQLGVDIHLVHMCASTNGVWAVDNSGALWYQSVNHQLTSDSSMSQAWLRIEPPTSDKKVTQVDCNSDGSLVYTLSENGSVNARASISEELPIGIEWMTVDTLPSPTQSLCTGMDSLWATDTHGYIFRRIGVKPQLPCGDYWKNIPGKLNGIRVSPGGLLWGLDSEHRLVSHEVNIHGSMATDESTRSTSFEEEDFEIL